MFTPSPTDNLVFHVVLPTGLTLTTGAQLVQPVTLDVISRLNPFYASVAQVKVAGGVYIQKIPDFTIAGQIYQSSQEADLVTATHVPTSGALYTRYVGSRAQYVTALAARDLCLNVLSLVGETSHVLANFSVTKKTDMTKRLDEFNDSIKFYEVVLRSGGRTMPGGKPCFKFAAKGVLDWTEATPGRTWLTNGMGANAKSPDFLSATEGRGKPVSFNYSPFSSPFFHNFRLGVYPYSYSIPAIIPGNFIY